MSGTRYRTLGYVIIDTREDRVVGRGYPDAFAETITKALNRADDAYVRGLELRVVEQRERAELAEADIRSIAEELRITKERLEAAQRTIQGFNAPSAHNEGSPR